MENEIMNNEVMENITVENNAKNNDTLAGLIGIGIGAAATVAVGAIAKYVVKPAVKNVKELRAAKKAAKEAPELIEGEVLPAVATEEVK